MTGLISVAMIVKDEEAMLEACLDSVKEIADELVIVDTGSVDKTIEIAKSYTDKVYCFLWQGDFSAARNFAINQCNCEWVLSIDADERIEVRQEYLRELITNTTKEAFMLPLKNFSGPGDSDFNIISVLRLFRNLPQYRYIGKIHEQIRIANQEAVGFSDYPVISHSYIEPRRRQEKRWRNLHMLTAQLQDEPQNEAYIKYYLGCEWLGLGRYQQAAECFRWAYEQLDKNHIFFRSSAVRNLVACLRFLGKLKEALAICMRETAVYPEYTDLFFDGGVVLEQMNEYEAARRWFEAAVSLKTPPTVYWHCNGTETFLAQYHLGHCCQILGRSKEAEQWYEQALAANPKFIYPLYGLYMVLITKKSCEEIIDYFLHRGYLAGEEGMQALGALLFTSGRPDLAVNVCNQQANARIYSGDLIKYYLYSSDAKQALAIIDELQTGQELYDMVVRKLEILCYTFLHDFDTAKAKCLAMWHYQTMRADALALLTLVKRLAGQRLNFSEKYQPVLIENLLEIIADCAHACGEFSGIFTQAAKCCAEILSDSELGSRALLNFWQGERKGIEMLLDVRYKSARGLYVWKKDGC
ncbi:MAG: glycosyl transferase family 2 [Firmicutes bacterium]|nr:glycosyl transferase family 2 [Bacillota bacterium]